MTQLKFILISLFTLVVGKVASQTNDSVRDSSLDSVTIKAYRYTSSVKEQQDGRLVWNVSKLKELPKILGNADPIRYTQMLPGVQTNSEYKSGVNILGCENSHNSLLLETVPIYNVNHLLGFFSAFNASHFSEMSVDKITTYKSVSNKLGGSVTMHHDDTHPSSIEGELTLGMISSQGSLKLPLNARTKLTISARQSYLNLLYHKWLSADEGRLNYSFGDYNVTLQHQITPSNMLRVDYYAGYDSGKFGDADFLANMKGNWGNQMASIQWLYAKRKFKLNQVLYTTRYANKLSLDMNEVQGSIPSSIQEFGYRGSLQWRKWLLGGELIYHKIRPQKVNIKGFYSTNEHQSLEQNPLEIMLYGGYTHAFTPQIHGTLGSKFTSFNTTSKNYFQSSPSASLSYNNEVAQISLSYALNHQNLFQTGFTDAGLPTEFWISADENNAPQYAHSLLVNASSFIFNRRYRISADLFYKKLYNQIEYNGSVLDFVNKTYNLQSNLLHGKGTNYGVSLMLQKCTGKLTGWLTYTYTHSRRRFSEFNLTKVFPSSHERPHDFKAVITYKPSKHWDIGGTFVYASGTPFTPPKSLNLINGNIIINYADYNSSRLSPYMRCDISVNYKWTENKKTEHSINLSLYNAFSNRNELFWRIKKSQECKYAYRPVSFVLKILPSISYSIKF